MKCLTHIALTIGLLAGLSAVAFADVVVISHPSTTEKLTEAEIKKIFLGKSVGTRWVSYDQPMESDIRKTFAKQLLGKNIRQLNSYWSYNVFTGRAIPPEILANDDQVQRAVASTPRSIGYISRASLSRGVKVRVLFEIRQ